MNGPLTFLLAAKPFMFLCSYLWINAGSSVSLLDVSGATPLLTSFKNLSGIHKRIQVIVFGLVTDTYHFSFPSEFHTSEYPSTQISFTCSNSLIETREEGVKYVQS